ncbi:hypothetical protein ACFFJX_12585 [Pseudarcicella hirudinis]|uniref:hypothetical protein n=1 Tax=Pseudarcicella hirudinis TaxID=1079859 RepID=UPI0035ED5E82
MATIALVLSLSVMSCSEVNQASQSAFYPDTTVTQSYPTAAKQADSWTAVNSSYTSDSSALLEKQMEAKRLSDNVYELSKANDQVLEETQKAISLVKDMKSLNAKAEQIKNGIESDLAQIKILEEKINTEKEQLVLRARNKDPLYAKGGN